MMNVAMYLSHTKFNATLFADALERQVTIYEQVTGTNCDPFASGSQKMAPAPRAPPPPGLAFFAGLSPGKEMEQKLVADPSEPTASQMTGSVSQNMAITLMQTVGSVVAAVVPQFVPPPVWNMQPLPCVPMVTGTNCLGAIMYPITFADAMLADKSDAALDSVIEEFPSLFYERSKGYPFPYATYVQCFHNYMSLQCAATFPTCTTIQSEQEFIPFKGRMPTCIHLCIQVLLTCPGFGFADIEDLCESVGPAPPLCALALYTRMDAIPPPIGDDSGEGKACPPTDPELDVSMDPNLYQAYEPTRPLRHFDPSIPVMKTVT